jgi:hypothetical protein
MSTEFVTSLLIAVILPLVGVIYAGIRSQQNAIESRLSSKIHDLETSTEKSLTDLRVDIRHRVETLNTSMYQSLQDDRRRDIAEFVKGYEALYSILSKRGMNAVLDGEEIK